VIGVENPLYGFSTREEVLRAPEILTFFPVGALTEGIVSKTSVRTGIGNAFPARRSPGTMRALKVHR
jgi:hypothetical protein